MQELTPDVDPKPSDPLHLVYDLLSNVTLNSTVRSTTSKTEKQDPSEEGNTSWEIHTRCGRGGGDDEKWFQMQDLRVEAVQPEMVFLGETVVQVWERRDLSTPR